MTIQEALDVCFGKPYIVPCDVHEEAQHVIRDACEKQIPKKPFYISETDENQIADVECPICHHDTDYSIYRITRGHCWKCGQLLDWSEEE